MEMIAAAAKSANVFAETERALSSAKKRSVTQYSRSKS